jgi:quinolinate synthase
MDGHCYVHMSFSKDDVLKNKRDYPNAEILVHPECPPEIQEEATYICSTGQMIKRAEISDIDEFVIATERDMVTKLRNEFPNKKFYPALEEAVCKQQKKIGLEEVYKSLKEEKYEVEVSKEVADKAKKSIERMIEGW